MLQCSKNCSIAIGEQRVSTRGNMNPDTKSTNTEAETIDATYSKAAFATMYTKGLERVVEVSKTSMDWAVQQNGEVLASYKKALNASPIPGLFLFDPALQAFAGYVTLQKSLLDLAVEQGTAVIEMAQGFSHDADKAKPGITNVSDTGKQQPKVISAPVQPVKVTVQLRIDTLLAKEIVDLVVKQQPAVVGTPVDETVADIVQLQVETNKIVDLTAKTLKNTEKPLVN
jgi:hypothetical protein